MLILHIKKSIIKMINNTYNVVRIIKYNLMIYNSLIWIWKSHFKENQYVTSITVENFSSIKDKVFLSLEPSKTKLHPENLIRKNNHTAVNVIAIYGANAAGKSNLFKAITTALIMIRNSNNVQVTDRLPVVPFKFDRESKNKPTSFEFTFIAKDGKKYIYGVQCDNWENCRRVSVLL